MPFHAPFPATFPLNPPIPSGLTGNPVSRAAALLICEGLTNDRRCAMSGHAGGAGCRGGGALLQRNLQYGYNLHAGDALPSPLNGGPSEINALADRPAGAAVLFPVKPEAALDGVTCNCRAHEEVESRGGCRLVWAEHQIKVGALGGEAWRIVRPDHSAGIAQQGGAFVSCALDHIPRVAQGFDGKNINWTVLGVAYGQCNQKPAAPSQRGLSLHFDAEVFGRGFAQVSGCEEQNGGQTGDDSCKCGEPVEAGFWEPVNHLFQSRISRPGGAHHV